MGNLLAAIKRKEKVNASVPVWPLNAVHTVSKLVSSSGALNPLSQA